MSELTNFYPPQRLGIAFQLLLIIIFLAAAVLGLWQAIYTDIGPMLIIYLLPGLFAVFLIPMLAYRIYGLRTAFYALEREGIHLRWGLRVEDIPIDHILWVHKKEELERHLPLPWFHWPGSLLGTRRVEGIGDLEFLASSTQGLIFLGTEKQVYAISPSDSDLFLQTVAQIMEMGSLAPIASRSVYPTNLMYRVWATRSARWLLTGSLLLSLSLFVWVSIVIPTREQTILNFRPDGTPGDLVPASRLLLLPILNAVFLLVNFFLGLFLFRKESNQSISILIWGSGAILPILFLIGTIFITFYKPV